jgi:tetratricopeptide (TPR) repeat protein
VLERLEPDSLEPELALALFDALVASGHMSEARSLISNVLGREELASTPAVLLRASVFAEQQGELDTAADTLDRALIALLETEGMTLADLRSGFARLFDLRARQARPIAAGSDSTKALAEALAVADRWRAQDPDNAQIDRLCAELLWSLGRDEEAWRHLSSTLDRHPADGEAIAWVADALENSGRITEADAVWARAIAVEPTSANHQLRRAMNLLASDREAEARAALEALVAGEWQDRFRWDVEQAKRLLRSRSRATSR